MNDAKYIGFDVHEATISAAVSRLRRQASDGGHSRNQGGNSGWLKRPGQLMDSTVRTTLV